MDLENARMRAAEEGRKYDGAIWEVIDPKDEIYNKVKFALTGTEENKFDIDYIAKSQGLEEDHLHYIIHLWAGKNGKGKWNEYFTDAISIINRLTSEDKENKLWLPKTETMYESIDVGEMFKEAWLIKWENDCLDDVSDLYIGVR